MLQIIKIGSACLFDKNGKINYSLLRKKAKEIESNNANTLLVISGSIALGKQMENETRSNDELSATELQGYASIGQIELMNLYQSIFSRNIAQLLLTNQDLKHKNHVKELLKHNIKQNRITIVNYNDGIDFEQLRKDNDTLAATLVTYINADRLIILGHYNGFLNKEQQVIPQIKTVTKAHYNLCEGLSEHGTGGFSTKLDAAKIILKAKKKMIIGNIEEPLKKVIEGKGTVFTST